jgi:hypothetical protein
VRNDQARLAVLLSSEIPELLTATNVQSKNEATSFILSSENSESVTNRGVINASDSIHFRKSKLAHFHPTLLLSMPLIFVVLAPKEFIFC